MIISVVLARSALSVIASTLAVALTPPAPMLPSQWATQNLVVPDGEYAGRNFDLDLTPYLAEPMDYLSADSDVNEVVVRKSAQTGFTLMLLGVAGYVIDRAPCDMMIVQPTDAALADFASVKLGRTVRNTPVLAQKVRAQVSRQATGSTAYEKKYGDYSLSLAIATSSSDLSSKTIKVALLDEIDRYPDDVDGQGDPCELVAGRQTMFLNAGTWKRLKISTPTISGNSAIDHAFQRGDKRYWNVVCPGCGGKFAFTFGPNFRFEPIAPHQSYYVAPCCGSVIHGWQKNALLRAAKANGGGWIATAPGAPYPSYHFDALSSPFVPWDHIAAGYVACGDDPQRLKPFYNLQLGLPYEVRGDAPDHVALMARREDYRAGHIPPGALLVTIAADVQMRGIWYEVVAWSSTKESWLIEADYLEGSTTDHDEGAFVGLRELYYKRWPDAYGNRHQCDEFGVDSGYRTGVVYEFHRGIQPVKCLKGADGWNVPALGGATPVDVDYRGKKMKGGATLRSVGTWPLKSLVYTRLALQPIVTGTELSYPTGYCHFGLFTDEAYFKQLTAEYLVEEEYRGRPRRVYKVRNNQDNHFLDCRVYNTAMADPYMASLTSDGWAQIARERGIPPDMATPDLFAPRALQVAMGSREPAVPSPGAPVAIPPVHGIPLQPAAIDEAGPPIPQRREQFDALFSGLDDLNRGL